MKLVTIDNNITKLYHYQSLAIPEHFNRIFTENTLYFSNPDDFNDPWDCRLTFNKEMLNNPIEYRKIAKYLIDNEKSFSEDVKNRLYTHRKFLENKIDELSDAFCKEIITQYRSYCLSTHPDSTLMWSHYGDSHRGVCLEFSVDNNLFICALK
jgi:hypothetical protein